ncbi:MAG: hypothetical protein J6W59_00335 [Bacteroidales bacterium]|nr:hypothetical protein [Bacteroidales bacterium]
MAGIILSTICAVFLGTAAADTTNVFIIDNVEVRNFNGSQLNGKTISAYDITYAEAGSRTIRKHIIKTAPSGNTINITTTDAPAGYSTVGDSPFFQVETENALIFLDGKLISEEEFKALAVKDVANLEEMKGRSATEFLQDLKDKGKYDGETSGFGIIVVTSKTRSE